MGIVTPTGTSRVAGLPKLRKHAGHRPVVAEALTPRYSGEVSVNSRNFLATNKRSLLTTSTVLILSLLRSRLIDKYGFSKVVRSLTATNQYFEPAIPPNCTLVYAKYSYLVAQQESNIQPTIEQGFACICVCQWLSNGFQPINVFRFAEKTGEIFILAGVNEGIEVIVFRNGLWEFNNDEQTEF